MLAVRRRPASAAFPSGNPAGSADIARPNSHWDASEPDPATSSAPFRVLNIGNSQPVKLLQYIEALEKALGKKAVKKLLPLQPGDVPDTFADVSELRNAIGRNPATPVDVGVARFVEWYLMFHGESKISLAGRRK